MSRKLILLVALIIVFVLQAPAQRRARTRPARGGQPSPQQTERTTARQVSPDNADLAITATVRAKELRFEVVPNPTVEFSGRPERDTLWDAVRDNLPRPVRPGVTYRNIGIRLTIVSRFADIERIVAEALGEIPVTDGTPPVKERTPRQPPQQSTQPPVSTSQPDGGPPQ